MSGQSVRMMMRVGELWVLQRMRWRHVRMLGRMGGGGEQMMGQPVMRWQMRCTVPMMNLMVMLWRQRRRHVMLTGMLDGSGGGGRGGSRSHRMVGEIGWRWRRNGLLLLLLLGM